jgi:hypothetical protein
MKQLLKGLLVVMAVGSISLQAKTVVEEEFIKNKEYITSIIAEAADIIPVTVVVYQPIGLSVPINEATIKGLPLVDGGSYRLAGPNDVLTLSAPIYIGDRTDKYENAVSVIFPEDKVYTYKLSDILRIDPNNQSGNWRLKIDKNGISSFEKDPSA